MNNYIILLTALLPIATLVYYIYHKDKKSPEPTGQLVEAFLFGILSVPFSFCMSIPLGLIGVGSRTFMAEKSYAQEWLKYWMDGRKKIKI